MLRGMRSSSHGITLGLHIPNQDSEHFPSLPRPCSREKVLEMAPGPHCQPHAPLRRGDEAALAHAGSTVNMHGVCRRLR